MAFAFTLAATTNTNSPTGGNAGIADFNGDGLSDLFFAPIKWPPELTELSIGVFLGSGDGSFTDFSANVVNGPASTILGGEFVTADFNGDGINDVFIADSGYDLPPHPGHQNSLFLSSNGGLINATSGLPQVLDATHSAGAGDVDGDGDIDLLVGNIFSTPRVNPMILINDGTGAFSISPTALPDIVDNSGRNFDNWFTSQDLIDLTGNGLADLVLGLSGDGDTLILHNDGNGKFQEIAFSSPGPFEGGGIAIDINNLDLNGDGRPDLLITYTKYSYSGSYTKVLVQQPDGNFVDETSLRWPQSDLNSIDWRHYTILADFDSDGDLDALATYNGFEARKPELWENTNGVFSISPTQIAFNSNVVRVGDFDGNGTPDLVSVNSEFFEVYLNEVSNDRIFASTGDQTIDGLAGDDIVVMGAIRGDVSVSISKDNALTVNYRSGSGGTDKLLNVEHLEFIDATMDLENYSSLTLLNNAQFSDLAKVYVAYFNRAADAEGLYFWADKLAEGMDMATIASYFSQSAEAKALYPDTADTSAFVTTVYANVLGRTPDQAGFDFWTTNLNNGTMQPATFVLSIIGGAQGADITYLSNKADLGVYFAAIKGMSDVADAQNVLNIFGDQATSNTAGAKASVDGHYSDATASGGGEFVFNLVGIVDNPFPDSV